MKTVQISVKEVEAEIFREFKAESVREGLKVGKAMTLAMQLWLGKTGQKPKMSFLKLTPKSWGNGTEKTSEQIDEVLY